ncbi:MAG TPA: carboxypeptidase-like regulatory domain-containing protein, partial [Mucilaginibacter sp.]
MQRSVKYFLGGLLVVLIHTAGLAQFKITGRVLNQADTRPLPYCSVFLKNATIGDKTATDGTFKLKNIRPGKYTMIFSIIGFEAYSQDVTISDADVTLPDVLIFPKTIALNEVTIKPDPYRERNYAWFKADFLGRSALAKECKILNPDVVYLSYDEKQGILSGSSTDFIEIENQALGYRVKYLLKEFTLDNKVENARKIHYEGSALFEEMKGSPAQQQRWEKRRLEVYQNSPEHFLRALLAGKTEAEGFRMMQLTGEGKSLRPVLYALTGNDILRPTDVPELTALTCDGSSIQIDYNKSHKFNQNGAANNESTVLTFKEPYMFFDANGGITNTAGVAFSGAWGRHRIAELLPIDFAMQENENGRAQIAGVGNNTAHDGLLNQALLKMTAVSDSLNTNAAIEKLYLQSDKPYYTLNDTLWFKAYLLNNNYLMPTEKSGIMNVDILNDSSKVIKQYRFPVGQGLTWGN